VSRIVNDEPVMAEVPRPGLGAVIAFSESPSDGRQINIVEIPVRIS
jgi:hypothetical protein